MVKLVVVSGYFNPFHVGHLDYLEAAKDLGDDLIVIVNNDKQVKLKGSIPFMSQEERLKLVSALRVVDAAVLSTDTTKAVCDSLRMVQSINSKEKIIFATGADHTPENTVAEKLLCESLGIEIVYGIGGEKVQSSSKLLEKL